MESRETELGLTRARIQELRSRVVKSTSATASWRNGPERAARGDFETNTDTRGYSDLTCPECGGPLYSAREARSQTYDCLVGHRWSPQSLFEEQSASIERALWLAVRSLEERGRLVNRLAAAPRSSTRPTASSGRCCAAWAVP